MKFFVFSEETSSDDWEKLSSGEKSPRKPSTKEEVSFWFLNTKSRLEIESLKSFWIYIKVKIHEQYLNLAGDSTLKGDFFLLKHQKSGNENFIMESDSFKHTAITKLYKCNLTWRWFIRGLRSVVSNSGQKMALRAYYFINVHSHFTTQSALRSQSHFLAAVENNRSKAPITTFDNWYHCIYFGFCGSIKDYFVGGKQKNFNFWAIYLQSAKPSDLEIQ